MEMAYLCKAVSQDGGLCSEWGFVLNVLKMTTAANAVQVASGVYADRRGFDNFEHFRFRPSFVFFNDTAKRRFIRRAAFDKNGLPFEPGYCRSPLRDAFKPQLANFLHK
jgi:hypothetical protein